MKCYISKSTAEVKLPHEGCTLRPGVSVRVRVAEFDSLMEARKALDDYKCTSVRSLTASGFMYAVTEYYIEDENGEVWTFADQEGE